MPGLSPDLLGAAALTNAVILGIAIALAPWLAAALLRWRIARLPRELSERFGEEWLAELAALDSRAAQLRYAIGLLITPTRALAGDNDEFLTGVDRVLVSHDVQVYAGAGARLPALILDALTVLPIAYLQRRYILPDPLHALAVNVAISLAWAVLNRVVLVTLFGGTAGKLLMGIRIVAFDGSRVTWRQATLRILPDVVIWLTLITGTAYILALMGPAIRTGLTTAELQRAIRLYGGPTFGMVQIVLRLATTGWGVADLLVYFGSVDRRALHDLIAGTAVVYKVPRVTANLSRPGATTLFR